MRSAKERSLKKLEEAVEELRAHGIEPVIHPSKLQVAEDEYYQWRLGHLKEHGFGGLSPAELKEEERMVGAIRRAMPGEMKIDAFLRTHERAMKEYIEYLKEKELPKP